MPSFARRPRYADVVGTLALLVAMSGTAYAATALPRDSVGSAQLRDKSVRSAEIKDGQVRTADLGKDSVGGTQVQNESVSLADLVGTDVTGPLTLSATAGGCGPVTLSVGGLQPGQSAVVSLVGATSHSLVFGPVQVVAAGQGAVTVCNFSGTDFNGTVTARIVSFG